MGTGLDTALFLPRIGVLGLQGLYVGPSIRTAPKGDAKSRRDYQDAERMRIEGSPSFVLNEGRQKLYGKSDST